VHPDTMKATSSYKPRTPSSSVTPASLPRNQAARDTARSIDRTRQWSRRLPTIRASHDSSSLALAAAGRSSTRRLRARECV
jgi:hypothetical protein